MSKRIKLNKKSKGSTALRFYGEPCKKTELEQRIVKFRGFSEKKIKEDLIKEGLCTYDYYTPILQAFGKERVGGTKIGDMLFELASTGKIKTKSQYKGDLLGMLRAAGMIEKIKGKGGKITIKINDKQRPRLRASAYTGRIIQIGEWKQMQNELKKKKLK